MKDRNTTTIHLLVAWCFILALWDGFQAYQIQTLKTDLAQERAHDLFQRLDFGVRTNTRWLIDASGRTNR